jgi:hypothetical protein
VPLVLLPLDLSPGQWEPLIPALERQRIASWTFYFRIADFLGGVGFLRGAPFGGLRASLTALPAWNLTALLAAILMVTPLCGFRPSRAGRAPR